MSIEEFLAKFKFDQPKSGYVGVEREQFVIDPTSRQIIPSAQRYLEHIEKHPELINREKIGFGYELSACQIESRIGPCLLKDIKSQLIECEAVLEKFDHQLKYSRSDCEVAPENMPLDIYPDPTGRYQKITKSMPEEILMSACRVAGTHVHIGMLDMNMAIYCYNKVIEHTENLMKLGDNSNGERMRLYKIMAPRYSPKSISSVEDLFNQAKDHGFAENPRSCWTMIRISIHGTIEFRMFGATNSIDQITNWVSHCHKLCFD